MQSNSEIEALLHVFDEPLRDPNQPASSAAKASFPASGQCTVRLQCGATGPTGSQAVPANPNRAAPVARGLIAVLIGISLMLMAILFVLLWQDMMGSRRAHDVMSAEQTSVASLDQNGSTQPKHTARLPEVALSSPDRIEADAAEWIEFPIDIDATDALPARSIGAVTALPEGASFSAGRPFGITGWSLRPDEIESLQLRLPERSSASDIQLALVAGDGTALAQSETRLSIAPKMEMARAIDAAAPEQIALVEATAAAAEIVPLPQRKPPASAENGTALKVNTVKVVTIKAPRPGRPHDGAHALDSLADEAQAPGKWMVTKTAVDMHAKAQQSSETVKVAEGGLKMRVLERDKRWIRVTDPATSTTGWIYDRFLEPADPPAQ